MLRILATVVALTISAAALAETPSYNYIEGVYQRVDLDDDFGPNIDGDGFGVGGSYEIAENWHIFGGYSTFGLDFDIDLKELAIGAGYHADISDAASLYANLAYINAEIDVVGFGSVDDNGYGVMVGVRGMVSERLELDGNLSYVDLGDGSDGTALGASALYALSDSFSLGLTAGFDEDTTTYGLVGRVYFGRK